MKRLEIEEVKERVTNFDGWIYTDNKLEKVYDFENFLEALDFINEIKYHVEEMNHHPDFMLYSYNKMRFFISTHDAGGITEKDFFLVEYLENKFKIFKSEK